MTRSLPVRQGSLWEATCDRCPAYDECGGAESAPCSCIHHGKRYRVCASCSIVCTQRSAKDSSGRDVDSFRSRLREGLPLAALRISQPTFDLPPLILSRSECLPRDFNLPDGWVGVHLRTVLSLVRAKSTWQDAAAEIRSRLRVNPSCRLVGVLSGDDDLLEALWGVEPRRFFGRMREADIEILTGPTYSIYGENPASHNVVMLLRHHRFCADAFAAGFSVIPNLYYNSRGDRAKWAAWLRENPDVHSVARDFSRTKHPTSFWPEINGLIEILRTTNRPLRVLLTGVGEQKMSEARSALWRVGASASFVSPRAIVAPPESSRPFSPIDRFAPIRLRIAEFRGLAAGRG